MMHSPIEQRDEEVETEKDHTSLLEPLKEYYRRALIALKTYEDDPVEYTKIRDHIKTAALNLTNFANSIEGQVTNITAMRIKRNEINKFGAEVIALLEKYQKPEA